MAVCFPSLEEINSFRVPLTPGERHLLNFLLSHLADNYEVYVQPFLNGDRPDFVVVRPDAGVLIIEVKDWHLEHYKNPTGGDSAWTLIKNGAHLRSPIAQVKAYKENLYNLHINELFNRNIKNKKYFSIVQAAVYFHNESAKDIQEFCHSEPRTCILGRDSLNAQEFNALLQKAHLNRRSSLFDSNLYTNFKRFLRPPEHNPDIGKEIKYRGGQPRLVESRAQIRQKIKGVAGCGKTKVLAGRAVAAYLRTRGQILILTFNTTLPNYIHDRISEVRQSFPWSAFEIMHYHRFFKAQANNYALEYDDLLLAADQEDFFALVKQRIHRYKTILVDEVQDYKVEWLRLLLNYFLAEDGEFVVFGDEKQNIYSREMGSDRFPVIPTIPGRWNVLKESFRMEALSLRIAQAFQETYFQKQYELDKDVEMVQKSIFESSGELHYHLKPQMGCQDLFKLLRDEIALLSIHPNDLVVLSPTYETVRKLEYDFRHIAHERTSYMGETKEEYAYLLKKYQLEGVGLPEKNERFKRELEDIRRTRKIHFWPNPGTVKLSTIHSFKGWETHTLILVICDTNGVEKQGSLNQGKRKKKSVKVCIAVG